MQRNASTKALSWETALPLRQGLSITRPSGRVAAALGAEIYASDTERKVVPHTCKSKSCPSCGHRATELWQREQWRTLPDIPHAGICLTMPDVLWTIFRQNRHLLHDLAALGAAAIEQWLKAKYGVRVIIMVVPHTFGRHLTFNAHLHVLVSAGGLRESDGRWISRLHFDKRDKRALMHLWRYAVITHLREALKANVLKSDCPPRDLRAKLTTQYERWWNIDIARFQSKHSSCDMLAGTFADRRLLSVDS